MSNHALLNNVDHKDLRIDTGHGAALGDDVMFAPTFPGEFRNLQAHYPVVFHRSGERSFQPVALFGFSQGQNLFLDGDRWDAGYVPLAIERQPFLIGLTGEEPMVHIDLDHPRVATGRGTPLFREHGGISEYLERISSVLNTLHQGLQETPTFVEALLRYGLLESFVLDIEGPDGARNRFAGFHTIDEDRLRALDADAVGELHRAGHLEPVYMAVASLSNLRALIDRMQRGHGAGR